MKRKKTPREHITFFVFTHKTGHGKKWVFPYKYLKYMTGLFFLIAIFVMVMVVDYIHLWSKVFEIKGLKAKEVLMAKQMSVLEEKINTFESSLARIKVFNQKLRTITSPLDKEIKSLQLVMGPIDESQSMYRGPSSLYSSHASLRSRHASLRSRRSENPSYWKMGYGNHEHGHGHDGPEYEYEHGQTDHGQVGGSVVSQDSLQNLEREYELLEDHAALGSRDRDQHDLSSFADMEKYVSLVLRINESIKQSQLEEQSSMDLWARLSEKTDILFSTPSITPTRGWFSSGFGYRLSPFTHKATMHNGVDIAARPGTSVVAAADGEVIFSGHDRRGYGNLISIDHGYGIVTRYGHNAKNKVHVGQKVKRGEVIALVGSTGRSTGPHLHYEIRRDGVPVNPITFFLDE